MGDFLQYAPTPETAYRSFRGVFSHWEACQILKSYFPEDFARIRIAPIDIQTLPSLEDEVSRLEISRYMRNQLLKDSDVMSMVSGLELRVPFVDKTLLESISSIPSNLRLQTGKKLLVQAVPEIPNWIFNRPKRGFMFPYEKWMQTEWQDLFSQVKYPSNVPLILWYRRWSLAILQHWWRKISE